MSAIFFLVALAAAAEPAIETVRIVEGECYGLQPRDGRVVHTRLPGLRVIERTAGDAPLAVDLPPGAAIMCPRSSIVPAPNDWKVLEAGYPLYIGETGVAAARQRIGVLEIASGRYRYRLIVGRLTEAEVPRVQIRLDQFEHSGRPAGR
ncbi:MAG: hypothetical protein QOC65_1392 [Sphingomonadales bacterium]|nr:hypothetical protein [Sphingomonadales bacterium]